MNDEDDDDDKQGYKVTLNFICIRRVQFVQKKDLVVIRNKVNNNNTNFNKKRQHRVELHMLIC